MLEKTTSPDQTELKAAQHFLESAAQTNLPELVKTLSDVLYQVEMYNYLSGRNVLLGRTR